MQKLRDAVLVSAEEAARRMAICDACPHMRVRPVKYCTKCGCALAAKTKLKAGACPIDKW